MWIALGTIGLAHADLLPVSWQGLLIAFHRAEIANGRVAPGRVAEAFVIIEQISPGIVPCAAGDAVAGQALITSAPSGCPLRDQWRAAAVIDAWASEHSAWLRVCYTGDLNG